MIEYTVILNVCLILCMYSVLLSNAEIDISELPVAADSSTCFCLGPKNVYSYCPTESTTKSPEKLDCKGILSGKNPCDEPKPNFKAANRRISEEKCEEYKWTITGGEAKWENDCDNYRDCKDGSQPTYGLINGAVAKDGDFPHLAAVGWPTESGRLQFLCGGTLISSEYVVTAAHCTKASDKGKFNLTSLEPSKVRLGTNDITEPVNRRCTSPVDFLIVEMIAHECYNPLYQYYDIALIRIERISKFNVFKLMPACLWTYDDESRLGVTGTVAGWGIVNTDTEARSDYLLKANVNFLPSKHCNAEHEKRASSQWKGISPHQICAGLVNSDTCNGDSGSPLQKKVKIANSKYSVHYVVGVTSIGFGCGENSPGVYTKISKFIDWIEQHVWYGKQTQEKCINYTQVLGG